MAEAHGPYGSLSYDLYHAQDIGPKPVSNKELFDWSRRAKALEDQIAALKEEAGQLHDFARRTIREEDKDRGTQERG